MLTERQRLILTAIVDDYISSAEPVGSRSISKRGDVAFSPATIRNEMADLEELGYLEQPHTSAGRIPSQKGYRYYVDHLVRLDDLSPEEVIRLKTMFAEKITAMEQVVQHTSTVLAQLTNYTSIALGPEMFNTSLRHFQLLPLSEDTAVAIIVTSTGHVENKTVPIPPGVSAAELEKVVNILNAKLTGIPLIQLRAQLYTEVGQELTKYVSHAQEMIAMIENVMSGEEVHREVYLSGTTNMLTQPEFKDVDRIKTIWDLLEETPTLIKVVGESPTGIQVRIGQENSHEAIANCSLITATYTYDGQTLGTIGLLGPTRMEYAKVMNLMNQVSGQMSLFMKRWSR
ncbi:heat-inducible transcriptional repressor HrcA [Paenibacillus sp. ACRRX]|uniref:heat-inducible transcriptional repressor HrcA n=1 Tax=unclassified Paenibacillus TaxID=185978 RepID=UPI001EF5BAF6|nr:MULTISPECIES: heat-inducible transcriptional repressor HrcA [unclassified Paenibacillus]MCG7407878.1 heat-inducible transcriptional repressor HrcA [Paenibacillus sp. ACRRX]MDK8181021.1 heat-inducible transcriptional repressor HrcA [Paenibacillus sp. UMB4589-SE434]